MSTKKFKVKPITLLLKITNQYKRHLHSLGYSNLHYRPKECFVDVKGIYYISAKAGEPFTTKRYIPLIYNNHKQGTIYKCKQLNTPKYYPFNYEIFLIPKHQCQIHLDFFIIPLTEALNNVWYTKEQKLNILSTDNYTESELKQIIKNLNLT